MIKKILKPISLIILILISSGQLMSDSPITSTGFSKAYYDIPIIKKAASTGILDRFMFNYLVSPAETIDKKAALINALSWKFTGKDNAVRFMKFMQQIRKTEQVKLESLTADETFALGYLTVMDDYFNPQKAIGILEKARQKHSDSFTVNIILNLTKAQKAMDSDWCRVFKLADSIYSNNNLKQDMRPQGKRIIYDYMVLYKSDCEAGK